jgi:hypothetical protein
MGLSIRWRLVLRGTRSAFVGASTYGVRETRRFYYTAAVALDHHELGAILPSLKLIDAE